MKSRRLPFMFAHPIVLTRWIMPIVVILALCVPMGALPSSHAQTEARYFPETGHFLRGAFRYFWETNGGSYIFGAPITEEYRAATTGHITQYFEKARFELYHKDDLYYVETGKLGSELTAGRFFPTAASIPQTAQRRYIPQTQHIIQYGFKEIWETRGGEHIFGLPISEELQETTTGGQLRTVQYFERVRFEYWPEMPPGQRVIISDLGRLLAPQNLTAPLPPTAAPGTLPAGYSPPEQPPQPEEESSPFQPSTEPEPEQAEPAPPTIPANVNATINPQRGNWGTVFEFNGTDFEPNEHLAVWLTSPNDRGVALEGEFRTNDAGEFEEPVDIVVDGFQGGVWAVTARGTKSEHEARGYFLVDAPKLPEGTLPAAQVPKPGPECANHVPTPREGLQAWVPNPTPNYGSYERVCARFILNGQVVKGAKVGGVVRFPGEDVWLNSMETKENGVAALQFKVIKDQQMAGQAVRIDVEIIYEDTVYQAHTEFTPN